MNELKKFYEEQLAWHKSQVVWYKEQVKWEKQNGTLDRLEWAQKGLRSNQYRVRKYEKMLLVEFG